ncbi:DUF2690 domain-containing protein [Streptomyces albogriseolus]|uniref:DUF2690 domain-containing protein n=1 Tax=Streptomyces albogriseolus TaxID=1887 RepID=UPI003460A3C1
MFKKTLGIVTAAVAMTALLPMGTAQAASCKGSGCTGRNPQTTGCGADAYTLKGSRVTPAGGGPAVELRVSPSCSAAWARIQKANSNWRFKLEIKNRSPYTEHASPNHQAHTAMVWNSHAYRACVEQYDGAGGSWTCTKWF